MYALLRRFPTLKRFRLWSSVLPGAAFPMLKQATPGLRELVYLSNGFEGEDYMARLWDACEPIPCKLYLDEDSYARLLG